MFILDRMIVGGIKFVLGRVADAARSEHDDTGAIKEELILAQARLESGEISNDEFAEIESRLFERLRAARGDRSPIGAESIDPGSMKITGVEVSSALDGSAGAPEPAPAPAPARPKKKSKKRRR